ncbi:MAG: penicillin acylase family protein, partial [Myxococcota bacterium]|nr:penicillin acylase family protein [Myxococcota bacterium]
MLSSLLNPQGEDVRFAALALLGLVLPLLAPGGASAGTTETIEIPGIEEPVTVYTDALGVPHVYAATLKDAAAVQGYVHARDRFFQMDVARRAAAGQLAELTGSLPDLQSDAGTRLLGLRQAAQRSADLLTPREQAFAQAYADGVNAYLAA